MKNDPRNHSEQEAWQTKAVKWEMENGFSDPT
jgi:hypothetical protein